jgi:hypothetical protein
MKYRRGNQRRNGSKSENNGNGAQRWRKSAKSISENISVAASASAKEEGIENENNEKINEKA